VSERCAIRRARPALGTIVELGARVPEGAVATAKAALDDAWRVLAGVERTLSAFDAQSDVGRFNAAPSGAAFGLADDAAAVLGAAADLFRTSDGLFDVTQGTGPSDWMLADVGGATHIHKRSALVRLDLGGIGKGYAVDRAFEALAAPLLRAREDAACWVNAGGDLRVGAVDVPVFLREEEGGGAWPWLVLRDGALATSSFGPHSRARLAGASASEARHVSVAAPRCMWSDALTKVVALTGRVDHPLLACHRAVAWIHSESGRCS
jgi:thiamine biosynthesis lipoprotein